MEEAGTEELVRVNATQTPTEAQCVIFGEDVWSFQMDEVGKEEQAFCCNLSGCGLEVGVLQH